MDFLFEWIHKLLSSYMWKTLVPEFRWVDWAFFLFMGLGFFYGAKRGLMFVLGETLTLMFIVAFVMTFYVDPAVALAKASIKFQGAHPGSIFGKFLRNIHPDTYKFALFVLISLMASFVGFWILGKLKKIFHSKIPGVIRVLGGALAGVVFFVVLWGFISQALILLPVNKIRFSYQKESGAFIGHRVIRIPVMIQKWVNEPFEFFGGGF